MSVESIGSAAAAPSKLPLAVIAGSHGSLHWAIATFYVLLPFIKAEFGLSYTEAGLLASVVHVSSFAINIPSGMIVDLTGRRLAVQLTSLLAAAAAIASLGMVSGFLGLIAATAMIAAMNTLWHPAAISFLSNRYERQRGLALSFHTIGASIGDALAPIVTGTLIALIGWRSTAAIGAVPPALAALLLLIVFGAGLRGGADMNRRSTGGVAGYLQGLKSLVSNSKIWLVCLLAGFRGTAQTGLRTFLPLYFVGMMHDSAFWLGIMMFLFQGAGGLSTPIAGAASDRYGRRPVILVGLSAATVLILVMPFIGNVWMFMALAPLVGAATFALRPVIQGWALDMTPVAMSGSTISLLFGTQSAFAMLIPIVGGVIADLWGIESVFYMLALTSAGAFVLTGAIAKEQR